MIEIGKIGKIIITKKLKHQIDFLHREIDNTEWSGILVYKHSKGKIKNMKNIVFKAEDFYLLDIGDSGTTGFEYKADDVIEMYNNIPEAINMNIGLLHSHHNMGAFHSGTDMNELKNNSNAYNYYVSLVVDFKETYKCKIGFPSKTKHTLENIITNTKGESVTVKKVITDNTILIGDLDVEIEKDYKLDDWIIKRYKKVLNNKHKVQTQTDNFYQKSFWDNPSQQQINRSNTVYNNFDNEVDDEYKFYNMKKTDNLIKELLPSDCNKSEDIYVCIDQFRKMKKLDKYFSQLSNQIIQLYNKQSKIEAKTYQNFKEEELENIVYRLECLNFNNNGNISRLIKLITEKIDE